MLLLFFTFKGYAREFLRCWLLLLLLLLLFDFLAECWSVEAVEAVDEGGKRSGGCLAGLLLERKFGGGGGEEGFVGFLLRCLYINGWSVGVGVYTYACRR